MFKNPHKQGFFLTELISFIFTSLDDPKNFEKRLIRLAISHSSKGIKAVEYGVIGEVLFWSLRQVLGTSYSSDVHNSWIKIFSGMLKIIVPMAIKCETMNNSPQKRRIKRLEEYCVVDFKPKLKSKSSLQAHDSLRTVVSTSDRF